MTEDIKSDIGFIIENGERRRMHPWEIMLSEGSGGSSGSSAKVDQSPEGSRKRTLDSIKTEAKLEPSRNVETETPKRVKMEATERLVKTEPTEPTEAGVKMEHVGGRVKTEPAEINTAPRPNASVPPRPVIQPPNRPHDWVPTPEAGAHHVVEEIVDQQFTVPIDLTIDESALSPQQKHLMARALRGESVFFTGPAGTGKSVLLRGIIRALFFRDKPGFNSRVAVTASTGMAALNIGGCTLHRWAGIGLGGRSVDDLIRSIKLFKPTLERWLRTRVLIVDEVSMIHADLIDKLNAIGKAIRKDPRPFGGIQLIFCGDFFQLPPVVMDGARDRYGIFAYDARCWDAMFPPQNSVTLRRVFRQGDSDFVATLGRLRKGKVSQSDLVTFHECERPLPDVSGVKPVKLYSRRIQVERDNRENLAKLPDLVHTYKSADGAGPLARAWKFTQDQVVDELDKSTRLPKELSLKIGAQVMLLRNGMHPDLVNGSMGTVIGFDVFEMAKFLPTYTSKEPMPAPPPEPPMAEDWEPEDWEPEDWEPEDWEPEDCHYHCDCAGPRLPQGRPPMPHNTPLPPPNWRDLPDSGPPEDWDAGYGILPPHLRGQAPDRTSLPPKWPRHHWPPLPQDRPSLTHSHHAVTSNIYPPIPAAKSMAVPKDEISMVSGALLPSASDTKPDTKPDVSRLSSDTATYPPRVQTDTIAVPSKVEANMTASASKVADTAGASKVDADTTAYASKVAGTAVTASNPEVHMPPIPGPDPRQPTTRPMVRVRLPVVRFMPNQRTKNSITMVVSPADADVEGPGGEVIASRCQIPLMLAWSMTIHKAQGLTLERVSVDLRGAFENGQVYVAISRVTSLDGLELVGFTRPRVKVAQRTLEWTMEQEGLQEMLELEAQRSRV